MPFKFIKHEISKAKQIICEKIGTAKPTELDEEFLKVESIFLGYYDTYVSLSKDVKNILYPNRTDRIFTNTSNRFKNVLEKKYYPHPELELSDNCQKFSNALSEFPIGPVLSEFSETYRTIVDCKHGLEESVKEDFLQPLKNVRINEMKTILKSRKKLEKYRLKYDALNRQYSSNSTAGDDDLKIATSKFVEKRNEVFQEMNDFLTLENTLLPALLRLTQILAEYYQYCSKKFQDLSSSIEIHHNSSGNPFECDQEDERTSNISKVESTNSLIDPETRPYCKVLYDYSATYKNDLCIKAGDIVYLKGEFDGEWFLGELDGERGYFPCNHVEVIVPLP